MNKKRTLCAALAVMMVVAQSGIDAAAQEADAGLMAKRWTAGGRTANQSRALSGSSRKEPFTWMSMRTPNGRT